MRPARSPIPFSTLLFGLAIPLLALSLSPAFAQKSKRPAAPEPPKVRLTDVRSLPIFHTKIAPPLPPKPQAPLPLRPPTRGGNDKRSLLPLGPGPAAPSSLILPNKERLSIRPSLPKEAETSALRILLFRRTFHRGGWEKTFLGGLLLFPDHRLRYYSTDRTYQAEVKRILQESLQSLRKSPSSLPFVWRLRRHLEKKHRLEVLFLTR